MKSCKILILVLFLFISSPLTVQAQDSTLLTLERIFSSDEFQPERFGPARWLEDGTGYVTLEEPESDSMGRDIVKYDPETGSRDILVPASRLIPPDQSTPLTISNYQWSQDGDKLLIFTNTKRVWRANTRGDYWVLNLNTWELQQLGGKAKPSMLMFAKFSPDGKKVGYVRKNNIYIEDLQSHQITQLTKDGSKLIINGTFDWVYEEEFRLRDGFRWSPDSKWIAYWQLNTEGVGNFYLINNTDSLYSVIKPIQYPKVGTTNSACRVGVVSAAGGKTQWIHLQDDPRSNYIARMDWADNSEEIVFQHLNRLQNTDKVMLGSAQTGEAKTILTEKDSAWLDVIDNLNWLNEGKQFTWVSERDGWRHVYLVSRNGMEIRCLTPGKYDVISIQKVDEQGGWLYYLASPDNPTQQYLYRTKLDGNGKPQRLTPEDQSGWHRYQISPDAKWAFHTYSSFGTPPVTELVRLPKHKVLKILIDNSELLNKIKALKQGPVEFFRIDIGEGVKLDAWQMKPPDFDPARQYPVLFYVYGEPVGQTVLDRWGRSTYLWHLMLTQQGYLVMSVDNRGTPAPRGRTWRKCVYRQVGILSSADQAAAARTIRQWDYVDSNRIGIWGWSGGGSMTLNCLFRYPDIYHTGMSVAPVTNQRYYDTIYQERYMGLPDDNTEGYKNGSPITFAHQLEGNLLLVHGTADDNVHYQNTEALINELIKHNKPFTMMSYPNRTHGINEGENTRRHLFELLTRYLNENLHAGTVSK